MVVIKPLPALVGFPPRGERRVDGRREVEVIGAGGRGGNRIAPRGWTSILQRNCSAISGILRFSERRGVLSSPVSPTVVSSFGSWFYRPAERRQCDPFSRWKSVRTLFAREKDRHMPRLVGNRLPKYGKHKASGQAVIKLGGQDIYLGPSRPRCKRCTPASSLGIRIAANPPMNPKTGPKIRSSTSMELLITALRITVIATWSLAYSGHGPKTSDYRYSIGE